MSSLFEIIETSSGEIVLKRADDESAPLIKINFSEEALEYLGEMKSEIGRAVISAGVQAVGNLYDKEGNDFEPEIRTIH